MQLSYSNENSMNSLSEEIQRIEIVHNSPIWKHVIAVETLGKDAASSGDPSLILSYCHEFYTLASILHAQQNLMCNELHDAMQMYNSGMSVEFGEYFLSCTYKILKDVKKQIC